MKNFLPHLLAVVLSVLFPFALVARPPAIAVDFSSAEGGVAESVDRNYAIRFGDGAKVCPGGPTGKPYLRFDGTSSSPVRFDVRSAASLVRGDEVAVSFWFRLDDYRKCDIAYGFHNVDPQPEPGAWNYGETTIRFDARLKPTELGTYSLWSLTEGRLPTNVWHHVAFRYSMSGLRFSLWFDGRLQRDVKTDQDAPRPIDGVLVLPMARNFHGALADIRIWNHAISDEELLSVKPSSAFSEKLASAYLAAGATFEGEPNATGFRDWCSSSAERVRKLASSGKAAARDWMELQKGGLALPYLSARMKELSASKSGATLADFPGLPITIYPYDTRKRLPWILPYDGKGDGGVFADGAPGEFEGRSFMVYPFRDVKAFHAVPSDLSGSGGAKIPSSAVDIRVVKCWFTSSGGWNSYFGGGREFGTLSPELLLHDDALVKVVPDEKANYVRCSYPQGDRYVLANEYGSSATVEMLDYNIEPIHDAKTFQPLPLEERELKQFWITFAIPKNTPPGRYRGKLSFTAEGKPCGAIPVVVNVHSFSLPRPSPRYNIDGTFFGTWMNNIGLVSKMAGGSYSNAIRRLSAEYKNMAEHNMLHPWTATFNNPYYPDFSVKQLELMKKAGLAMRPIFGDIPGYDGDWLGMVYEPQRYNGDTSVEGNRALFDERCLAFSNRVATVLDRIEKLVGHREVYFYGIDEAGQWRVRREMPFFMIIRMLGGHPFITSGIAEWAALAVGANDAPSSMGRTTARNWHEGGATVCSYAAPFAGPENPEAWRRNKGIRLYMSNFDGCNENVWYSGLSTWNDFIAGSEYKPFCIVYPTADGVLDTIAWEAMREGFDDIRYLTLARRLARHAIRSGDRSLVRLGKSATIWAELIDPESVRLDKMRADAVDWINRLLGAFAKKGVEVPDRVYR